MEEYIKRMNKERERLITALAEICDILPWDSASAKQMIDIAEAALSPNAKVSGPAENNQKP